MKKLLSFIFTLFLINSSAQSTINISGTVNDQNAKSVDLAMVALLNSSDSSYVKSEFTDMDGTFEMSNIPVGLYIIQVNLLGYKEYKNSLEIGDQESKLTIPIIVLLEDSKLLDQVTIKGKTPYIERKIDRTVVTPDALISNAGKDALEVLEAAPGVTLGSDGSLMLKGRSGVSVFINDKPSYLSGTELENYLRSLPAGSIKRIEIMTNPPAQYEAAGNSGVINIIIKRNTLKGFYGNTSIGFRQGKKSNSNNSLNLNFNKNKVSLFANIYGGFYNSIQDLNINRYYKDSDNIRQSAFNQNSMNTRGGKYINTKVGLDFYASDNTTIGASYKNVSQPGYHDVISTSLISDADQTLMQRVVADNNDETSFSNGIYNVYLTQKLDTLGSKITFDADYLLYNTNNNQTFQNSIYSPEDALTYQDQINGDIPSEISIYAAKSDYTKPFADGSKFDAGIKIALTKTDNEAIYSNTIGGTTTPNYDLSNRFIYDERINAGYLNYTRALGKVNVQAGLRGESTNLTGEQLGNVEKPDTTFTRTYTSLFPTFYASTPLDSAGNNTMTFSYGRRINRPYFQDLNPFISPLDRFTFYSGNPDLLPTFSHNLSLTHSYKGFLNTSLNYAKTVDGIQETLEIRDGIYYSRPGNIASSQTITLSVDFTKQITPWYSFNSYAEIGNLSYESDLYTEQLKLSGTYYFISANNSFQLGKGWKADIGGRYITDLVAAQLVIKSYGLVSLGVQKSILDGKGTIKLNVNDPFYTRRGAGIINNLNQTDADWNSKFDTRYVSVTFSLRFGKSTSNKQKYNSSGSSEEQGRVKG